MLKTKNKYLRFTILAVLFIAGTLLIHTLLFHEPLTYKAVMRQTVAGILYAAVMMFIFKHGTPPAKENNQNKRQ